MPRFAPLASLDDLPDPGALEVEFEGRVYALFRRGAEVFALDGICPHQGGPLARGAVAGTTVACPWHGWQFDLRDGRCPTNRALRQPSFAVRVEGGAVLVAVP